MGFNGNVALRLLWAETVFVEDFSPIIRFVAGQNPASVKCGCTVRSALRITKSETRLGRGGHGPQTIQLKLNSVRVLLFKVTVLSSIPLGSGRQRRASSPSVEDMLLTLNLTTNARLSYSTVIFNEFLERLRVQPIVLMRGSIAVTGRHTSLIPRHHASCIMTVTAVVIPGRVFTCNNSICP